MYEDEMVDEPQYADLRRTLTVALSNAVVLKFKAQGHHWNVTGPFFSQLHDFFGDLYSEYEGTIDPLAENIRKIGYEAPSKLVEFAHFATVSDENLCENFEERLFDLIEGNSEFITSLNRLFSSASAQGEQGIADYAAGAIDLFTKYDWQLKAHFTKEAR